LAVSATWAGVGWASTSIILHRLTSTPLTPPGSAAELVPLPVRADPLGPDITAPTLVVVAAIWPFSGSGLPVSLPS